MRLLACGLFVVCFGSYQSTFAGANEFTAVRVRSGDNVSSILRQNGFTGAQRDEILRRAPGLADVILTTDVPYFRAKAAGEINLKIHDVAGDESYRVWRKAGRIGAETYRPSFHTEVKAYEGRVRGSLMSSLLALVPSNWVASRFMDAFLLERDLASLPAGARFAFSVEKKFEGGVFVKYGEVRSAALELNGRLEKKTFVRFQGGGVFVSARDRLSERPFYAPVGYLRIASLFQPDRRHPVTGRVQPHMGIDFEMPMGAPVLAPRKGVVVRRGRNHASGNYLVLLHANGVETAYNHLRKLDPSLREGTRVDVGRVIGEVGCTGYCTRPHLHFAVKMHGRMVDPAKWIKPFPARYEAALQDQVALE